MDEKNLQNSVFRNSENIKKRAQKYQEKLDFFQKVKVSCKCLKMQQENLKNGTIWTIMQEKKQKKVRFSKILGFFKIFYRISEKPINLSAERYSVLPKDSWQYPKKSSLKTLKENNFRREML